MSRDNILHRIRTALGRSAGQAVADPPPVRIRIPDVDMEQRIATMFARIEALVKRHAFGPSLTRPCTAGSEATVVVPSLVLLIHDTLVML